MKRLTIYKDQARYYDLIYSWKNYKKEAETIRRLIAKNKKSTGRDLLEVACGTGGHIQYLKNHFQAMGTDINNGMLGVARKKIKGVRFQQADMVALNLGRKFDAIICLFSSIGYLKTDTALKKTLRNFARHLKDGGVVIIEPWLTKGGYTKGHPSMATYGDDNTKIARLNISNVRGDISVLDMHYLIAERNKEVKYFIDRHELRMVEPQRILQFMREAGLHAKFVKDGFTAGRGLYIGVKA